MRITTLSNSGWLVAGVLALSLAQAQNAPDFSKVEIKATKVTDKFYTIEGQGRAGAIGVLLGPDGVLMVDTQFAPLSDKIAAAIRQLTPLPIRYVVNTHAHGDHTGGNVNFGRMGATIIARDQTLDRMLHPTSGAGQPLPPIASIGMPKITFSDRMTLYLNGEVVQLIAVPRAHTDGDLMVWFPGLDVVMCGDFYRSIQFPHVARDKGGTLRGLIDGMEMLIGRAGPNTKIIPGHGPPVDRTAVIASLDMVLTLRQRVAELMAQGKSEDEVVAAKVTADYDARIQQPGTTAEGFVRQVYQELLAH